MAACCRLGPVQDDGCHVFVDRDGSMIKVGPLRHFHKNSYLNFKALFH